MLHVHIWAINVYLSLGLPDWDFLEPLEKAATFTHFLNELFFGLED